MEPIGFIGLATGLVAATYVTVYAQIRLQHAIKGEARATVTSVAGLGSECTALLTFGAVAGLSLWLPLASAIAAMAVPMLLLGLITPRLLGSPRDRSS